MPVRIVILSFFNCPLPIVSKLTADGIHSNPPDQLKCSPSGKVYFGQYTRCMSTRKIFHSTQSCIPIGEQKSIPGQQDVAKKNPQ